MTRYYCCKLGDRYHEDYEFEFVFGEAADIGRLYRHLADHGVTPRFLDEPKFSPERTYGIEITYDTHGYPWMRVLGNETVLSILAGMADGTIEQQFYYFI